MPKRINELTDEQRAQMAPWAEKWTALGLQTGEADWATFQRAIGECYSYIDLPPPPTIRVASPVLVARVAPVAGLIVDRRSKASPHGDVSVSPQELYCDPIAALQAAVEAGTKGAVELPEGEAQSVLQSTAASAATRDSWHRSLGGQFFAYWPAFTSFLIEVCGLELSGDLMARELAFREAMISACWSWCHSHFVVVSERPVAVHRDPEGRLHHPAKQAIYWPDGFGLYRWHGTAIPSDWITSPESLDVSIALTHENLELRRCAAEIIGWEKVLKAHGYTEINADPDPAIGTLVEVDLPDADREQYVLARCPTGRDFALWVGRAGQYATALDAQSAINQVPKDFFNHLRGNRS